MNLNLEHSTKIILKVALVVLALAFLWAIRDIVVILLLAVVLASAMEPMAEYLSRRRVPRSVSVLGAYVIVIALVALVAALIIPPMVNQFQLLAERLPDYSLELQAKYPLLHTLFGNFDLGNVARELFDIATGSESLFSKTVGIFNGFFAIITVLVVSFYLVAADKGMKRFISDLVPGNHQVFVESLISKIQHKMGMWVIGQVILSLFIFVLTFIGLTILGVDYALFLAVLAGLLEVVPYLGPFLSAVPAVFFALVQNPPLAAAVVILYILIQKTEGYVLVPKIMEKTVGTSPLVVLIALLVGFKLGGVLGLLLAVPLAGAITVVIHEFSHQKPVPPAI
jgi:predicted PurR-regulated permease PerM